MCRFFSYFQYVLFTSSTYPSSFKMRTWWLCCRGRKHGTMSLTDLQGNSSCALHLLILETWFHSTIFFSFKKNNIIILFACFFYFLQWSALNMCEGYFTVVYFWPGHSQRLTKKRRVPLLDSYGKRPRAVCLQLSVTGREGPAPMLQYTQLAALNKATAQYL